MIPNNFIMNVNKTAGLFRVRINADDIEAVGCNTNIHTAIRIAVTCLDTKYTDKIKRESVET